ncbi:hypothetical protein [Niveispirillum lacus]|uniref:hypothetical protein n=1 Tax=Niveispirillum lacus TaxID=1981099 RepID=UPI001056757D|nr:hypothetical protein [Niveispirillum lacus]
MAMIKHSGEAVEDHSVYGSTTVAHFACRAGCADAVTAGLVMHSWMPQMAPASAAKTGTVGGLWSVKKTAGKPYGFRPS